MGRGDKVLLEYAFDKGLDKGLKLIKDGYRRLDTNQSFNIAYENALTSYKNTKGEDNLYKLLYQSDSDYFSKWIKSIFDTSFLSREAERKLSDQLLQKLENSSSDDVKFFLTNLFAELLFTSEYSQKIVQLRRDTEVGEIYNCINELKSCLSFQNSAVIKFQNNKFQHYLTKWNDVLFLHRENSSKKKLRLKDFYLLPCYNERNSGAPNRSKNDLDEKIDLFLSTSLSGNRKNPYIILADAGMGKSSLISYICSKAPLNNNLIVLRFLDLNEKTIRSDSLLVAILKELKCDVEDLRNKRLILDGLDESKVRFSRDMLMTFFNDCKNITGLKVLLTSRVNYIDYSAYKACKVFYLNYFNEEQIQLVRDHYFKLTEEPSFTINKINDIVGIPLILYMILSLHIQINEETKICELYEKIFVLDGGIYDRMTFDETDGYTEEIHPIAYSTVKPQVHKISQELAFCMFELNSITLPEEIYKNIVRKVSEDRLLDFAVANYYYIENTLSFVHKSIYEYFVAEYVYVTLKEAIETKEVIKIKKSLAFMFKANTLTNEILMYLNHKIINDPLLNSSETYLLINSSVASVIEEGMTYHLTIKGKNVLTTEETIFINCMELLNLFFLLNKNDTANNYKNIEISSMFLRQLLNRSGKQVNCSFFSLDSINFSDLFYLTFWDLSYSMLYSNIFNGSCINYSVFEYSTITQTVFSFCTGRATSFKNSIIKNSALNNSIFDISFFNQATIENTTANNSSFLQCDFSHCKIINSNFSNSDFSNSSMYNAVIKDVIMEGATFSKVDLRGATISGLNLHFARIDHIQIDQKTTFENIYVDDMYMNILLHDKAAKVKGLKIYSSKTKKDVTYDEFLAIKKEEDLKKENIN